MVNLQYPIIQAPMSGGVSTPELAAAVSNAGGLGFLAAGYKSTEQVKNEIQALKKLTSKAFGVNTFVPNNEVIDQEELNAYRNKIEKEAVKLGTTLGVTYDDDDEFQAKIRLFIEEKVPVVSFTFGCPSADVIKELQLNGTYVIVTVTTLLQAILAVNAGADALCLQGIEAGGHRATFTNDQTGAQEFSLFEFISVIRQNIQLPIIAAGGLMNGEDIQQALKAGASAVQLGTAFLLCPESGTNPVYRKALQNPRFSETAITRAFTGRRARGLVNDFLTAYTDMAPAAFPYIHQMTKPLRQTNNEEYMSLWAGTGFKQCRELPAGELMKVLMEECAVVQ